MEKESRIYVAGHRGLVGSAIMRKLTADGYSNLIVRSHEELDLTNQSAVYNFFAQERPEYVFVAAALVGGIQANNMRRAEFLYQNLQMQLNIIDTAYYQGVKKLLFLGSSCIYPKTASQPISEDLLLTGPLEPTNEPYAIAKIAGIKMCESYNRQYGTNFIAAIPAGIYGPEDHFDGRSHILGALINRFHVAKKAGIDEVTLWGTGRPLRELLHADDAADGIVYTMNNFTPTEQQVREGDIFLNIGSGDEYAISELAVLVAGIVGYTGKINWDISKPDGMYRKLLNSDRISAMGWKRKIIPAEGIERTYKWYCENL